MPSREPRTIAAARRLRAEPTPAEQALWRVLRRFKEAHWRRQTPIGGYIADFACLKAKLIIEVDGGAHDHAAAERRDASRTAALEAQGFLVRRFTNAEVLHDPKRVAEDVSAMAAARLPSTSPSSEESYGGTGSANRSRSVDMSSRALATTAGRTTAPPPPAPPPTVSEEGRPQSGRPSRRSRYTLDQSRPPAPIDPATLVLVGAIAGAFGVRGEVRVRSFTAAPEGVAGYGPLYDASGRTVLTPKRWRPVKDGLAISGPEIVDRDAAEAAKGTALHVPRAALPPAEEDEYYHVDLIGCRVETIDGAALGVVVAVHDFGAGDVLELRDAAGAQQYLDFSRAEVPIVDLANRRLVATPAVKDEA